LTQNKPTNTRNHNENKQHTREKRGSGRGRESICWVEILGRVKKTRARGGQGGGGNVIGEHVRTCEV